jgi:hypothetical protein
VFCRSGVLVRSELALPWWRFRTNNLAAVWTAHMEARAFGRGYRRTGAGFQALVDGDPIGVMNQSTDSSPHDKNAGSVCSGLVSDNQNLFDRSIPCRGAYSAFGVGGRTAIAHRRRRFPEMRGRRSSSSGSDRVRQLYRFKPDGETASSECHHGHVFNARAFRMVKGLLGKPADAASSANGAPRHISSEQQTPDWTGINPSSYACIFHTWQ